jgi:hypothetical protein
MDRKRPYAVRVAVLKRDSDALSSMGHCGALKKAMVARLRRSRLDSEFAERDRQAHLDICPIDKEED